MQKTAWNRTSNEKTGSYTERAPSGSGNAVCRDNYADAESSACRFRGEASEWFGNVGMREEKKKWARWKGQRNEAAQVTEWDFDTRWKHTFKVSVIMVHQRVCVRRQAYVSFYVCANIYLSSLFFHMNHLEMIQAECSFLHYRWAHHSLLNRYAV